VRGASVGLEGGEPGRISEVRGDRHRAGIASRYQLGVDHSLPDPDVGEQSAVAVAFLGVQIEPDGVAGDQRRVHPSGGDATWGAAARRPAAARPVPDLRRVDADVTHPLDVVADPDVDSVTVVDMHDGRLVSAHDLGGRDRDPKPGR
jgi:hypothetical protein